jgi:hypothetical protein
MSFDKDQPHSKQVDIWIKQNTTGLSPDKLLLIFEAAIQAIQKRTAITLSEVTLAAIFDRVLYMSQKKFPILSVLKFESNGISFDGLMANAKQLKSHEITEAFRFFLIQFITLLGNLTADILTPFLYQELFKITSERVHSSSQAGHRGLRSVKNTSDRGDV